MRAHPYFKKLTAHLAARVASASWAIPDLCKAYQFPTGLTGGGVIGIVELSGGWQASDMSAFFGSLGQPVPSITDVSVDETKNTPGSEADGEVALDIQVAAAAYFIATGKTAAIRVYWCQDIAMGVRAATSDGCDVCSISWGADEAVWGATSAQDMEAAAAAATAAGMIVFAAAGDNDSSDGGDGAANVDCPASCPSVVGCGGTTKSQLLEVVWNNEPGQANGSGTGGGYSTLFPVPDYQSNNGAPPGPGRMVPDVAANADPNTGYQIFYGGQPQIVGGTSAVAPLYAGFFAACGVKLGASINTLLWTNRPCFVDVTQGDNGMYRATTGPDPCTGLGVPVGTKLAALFPQAAKPAPNPLPDALPSKPPPILAVENAVAWACSELPTAFMTKGTAAKHIASGLAKNWPKDGVSPNAAARFFDEHYRLLAERVTLEMSRLDAEARAKELERQYEASVTRFEELRAQLEEHEEAHAKAMAVAETHAQSMAKVYDEKVSEFADAHTQLLETHALKRQVIADSHANQLNELAISYDQRVVEAAQRAAFDQAAALQEVHQAHAAELAHVVDSHAMDLASRDAQINAMTEALAEVDHKLALAQQAAQTAEQARVALEATHAQELADLRASHEDELTVVRESHRE